jgi:hypothetical protein
MTDDDNAAWQRRVSAAAKRVTHRASVEASRLLERQLLRDLEDLASGEPMRPGGWLTRELGELLADAEDMDGWQTTDGGLRFLRLPWCRGLRVRLVVGPDGGLVSVLPEGARRGGR